MMIRNVSQVARGITPRMGAGSTSASSARIPPSPSWSARITKVKYLMLTTKMSDHRIKLTTPVTFSEVGAIATPLWKHWRNAYNGSVPMSPKTTPSAASAMTPLGLALPPFIRARGAVRAQPASAFVLIMSCHRSPSSPHEALV